MAGKFKITKGDEVKVISGSEKGKRGTVLEINQILMRVKVQGVKLVKKHDKKDGIQTKEAFIDYSNVKKISDKKPVKKTDKQPAKKAKK